MANEQNLIPQSQRSPSEIRENGRKGGKASGKARRKKRQLKEIIALLGDKGVIDGTIRERLEALGLDANEWTQDVAAVQAMYDEVIINGNVAAFNTLRDTKGEKPTEKQEISMPSMPNITIVAGDGRPISRSEDEIED